MNIEVHHLIPESQDGGDDIDNAIPLCFDCHSDVNRYNDEHPKGTKYKIDELRSRREQVYEEFTRHLIPPVDVQITQTIPTGGSRVFPDVGLILVHLGDGLPVKVRVLVESVLENRRVSFGGDYYSGTKAWPFNPRFMFSGHFDLPNELVPNNGRIELRVTLTIVDQYEREHVQFPRGFVYVRDTNSWYAEP